MIWTRKLWGVHFIGADGEPILIGATWHDHVLREAKPYPGEPTRALLFCTRRDAWDWCVGKNADYRRDGWKWRVRPVRVVESVRVAK